MPIVTIPDGKRFEGELRDGLPHGSGVVTSPDGTSIVSAAGGFAGLPVVPVRAPRERP